MTWIKLDDRAPRHPKVAGLTDRAFRWWVLGLCYASEFLTDGILPRVFYSQAPAKVRTELVNARLWDWVDPNFFIHDYLEHQSSRDYVLQERDMKRRRSAFHRDDQLKAQIRERDGDNCRYCGRRVSWSDRRGPAGGTYDHVLPRGPETVENLVVCCRFCNNSKGPRTPDQARMTLLEPRTNLKPTRNESGPENREQRTDTENRVKDAHAQPQPVQGVGAFEAGSLPKDHRNHALCGAKFRLCLSYPVFGKFVGRYGGTKDEARAALQAWVDRLEAEHQSIGNYLWLDDHFTAFLRQSGRLKDAVRVDDAARDLRLETIGSSHDQKIRDIRAGKFNG